MGGQGGSAIGASATVDSAGEIEKRITATRIVFTGIFALAWRKKKDNRELYLLIEGADFSMVASLDPKQTIQARKFAAAINTASRGGMVYASSLGSASDRTAAFKRDLAAAKKVKEAARRAALTPEQRKREDILWAIFGVAFIGFILFIIIYSIVKH